MGLTFGWILFILTLAATGYWVTGWRSAMTPLERIATGTVVGAAGFPFLLFVCSAVWGVRPFSTGFAGLSFTLWLTVALVVGAVWIAWHRRATHLERVTSTVPSSARKRWQVLAIIALLASIVAFAVQLVDALSLPLFGWDEYSYWLYAAKALYVTGGFSGALATDAYNTYPLGFPYLVAYLYHLTGGVSIPHAKWVTPFITLATLVAVWQILKRLGATSVASVAAIAIIVWGCQTFLWYNAVAFGEMSYVDLYTLACIYAVAWLRTENVGDAALFGCLLGLSTFLRVDGSYIAAGTFLLVVAIQLPSLRAHWRTYATMLTAILLPILAFRAYLAHASITSGWTSRVSWKEVLYRLQPSFLSVMSGAIWHTVSNLAVYPIVASAIVLLVLLIVTMRRDVAFLLTLSLGQIAYLFIAYLTVFSRFEALRASSMDRYLLRIDPLLALALILALSTAAPARRSTRRRKGSQIPPQSESA